MATQKQSSTKSKTAEAIDNYERQAQDYIAQGEELVKDVPVVREVVGVQADVARLVVDAQALTARQLIGA